MGQVREFQPSLGSGSAVPPGPLAVGRTQATVQLFAQAPTSFLGLLAVHEDTACYSV